MKRIEKIICIVVFLMGSSSLFAQKAEREHIRSGNELYESEKYTESEIEYRKALEVNPRSIEGTYNLGNSLYKQKKYPEAAEQYQLLMGQAERMKESSEGTQRLAQVYHNVGNIFMNNKDYAKSVEAYKQSLRLNPSDDETRYNLALAQKLLHDQQEQQQDQSQNQENQDQDENKDQQDQQKQQQQPDDQQQNKTQEQAQPDEQMSRDNAQQILEAFLQDEKNTQEKVKKAQMQQQQRRKTDKEW